MEFFSSIGSALKSVGRAAGKVISKIGEVTGSEKVKEVGDRLTAMCTEVDKTAKRTSEEESYDRGSAKIAETQRINKILSDFSLNLQKQADDIENIAIKESQIYFDELISVLAKINIDGDIKINIDKIKRELAKVNHNIRGSFKRHLAKRVSIDDIECLEILKMDAGSAKESAMKKFGNKVLKEAKEELCHNIKEALFDQQKYISDEVNEKINVVILNLKDLNSKVAEFEMLKQSDEEKIEFEKLSCINKIQCTESLLSILSSDC